MEEFKADKDGEVKPLKVKTGNNIKLILPSWQERKKLKKQHGIRNL